MSYDCPMTDLMPHYRNREGFFEFEGHTVCIDWDYACDLCKVQSSEQKETK